MVALKSLVARRAGVCALVVLLAIVVGRSAPAAAQKGPEKTFAGKVILSDKRFPTYAKSPAAYTAAIKKQSKLNFQEDKANGTWKIHFAAFLKQPLNDLEVLIKLYDVTNRSQTMLASFEQFLDTRGQRTIISSFKLERKQVGVNKELMIILEYRGRSLASGRFRILGEAEKFSGKVDFSDEDTKKSNED